MRNPNPSFTSISFLYRFIDGVPIDLTLSDIGIVEELNDKREIQRYKENLLYSFRGEPVYHGNPNSRLIHLAGFIEEYKLGFVKEPVFASILVDNFLDPINFSKKIIKYRGRNTYPITYYVISNSGHIPVAIGELYKLNVINSFNRNEYNNNVKYDFKFYARDIANQYHNFHYKYYAKSLFLIIRPVYDELDPEILEWKNIKERIREHVKVNISENLIPNFSQEDRYIHCCPV